MRERNNLKSDLLNKSPKEFLGLLKGIGACHVEVNRGAIS